MKQRTSGAFFATLLPTLLTMPATAVFMLFFGLPLALLFAVSFWSVKNFQLRPGFSLAAYGRAAFEYGDVIFTTVAIGGLVALLATALGFVFAYGARFRAGRFGDAAVLAVMLTMFGGYLVKIYAWKSILAGDGIINSLLLLSGLRREPVTWLIYNGFSVTLALVYFLLPLAVLPLYASLRNVNVHTLEAARDLGANRWQALWRVVLPQCRSGIFSSLAICFLGAAGDYVTPQFLGNGSGMMIGQFVAQEFSTRFNWPAGAALSFTLMAACALVLFGTWVLIVRKPRS
jgi:spermidine/putrescine transport system permease protein